ncbi:MAG: DUF262 domain-containing protein [Hyphomonas sp.]
MEARSKSIEEWFSMISQGQVMLPRFQRHEAWGNRQIVGLLENILRKPSLPIGALLVLDVGDKELFHSRPIVGAPEKTGRVLVHLLDGQQRMTALWRSFTGDYEDFDVFVSLEKQEVPEDDEGNQADSDLPLIERVKRFDRKGVRQPVWANSAKETYARGLFPIQLLRPGAAGETIADDWLNALDDAGVDIKSATKRIYQLRQRVANYAIPFLSLGVGTGRETALDVFIKMNTSGSPLKDFDIVVAQLEEASGQSLHDMVLELKESEPAINDYGRIEDMILSVAALLIGKAPLKKTYLDNDFGEALASVWERVKKGFRRGVGFLRQEGIFNDRSLPSDVAVYLVCALWADVPDEGRDAEGNARAIIRKTLWRACFTDRYVKTSATRAYADYKSISEFIRDPLGGNSVELFDELLCPLPEKDELLKAGWPGRKDRLPRAILAASLRAGGYDFADGAKIDATNYYRRELHHVFPVFVLGGERTDVHVARALNCALITWSTNRMIAANSPKDYIEQRAIAAHLGENEVRQRLSSHLIPYDAVIAGDYDAFLDARAELIAKHMKALCDGQIPV